MNRRILMFIAIFAGALLQQLLPGWPIFGGIKPPVLMALTLFYALRREGSELWWGVIFAAVLQDGLEYGHASPCLLIFPVFSFYANRIRTEIFADGVVTLTLFGAAAGIIAMFVTIVVYGITGQRPMHFGYNLMRLLGSGVLGAITLPVISLCMNKLEASLPKRRGYGWQ
jgi:cell shape-determining protein MreD